MLARSEFLAAAPTVMLNNLLLAFRPLAVEPGDTIVEQGAAGGEMYFVCRGELEVLGGSNERVGQVREGEFFGEMSVLFDQPRNATVRAVRHCDLLVLDAADFHRIAGDFPQMEAEFRRIAAGRRDGPTAAR